jgi:diguanylate cyclase (GGDEF)-like protein
MADVFYLGFYPLAYVAIVLFMRSQSKKITATNWLDGAISGFGAAAACAAFAFHSILQSSSATGAGTVVNLALPIGDALLLGLIAGGFAVLSGRRRGPWILLASGMALNVVGDASNLFQHSLGATSFGQFSNAVAWPIAIVLMSMAVWLRPTYSNPLIPQRRPGFVLPVFAAAAALGILFAGTLYPIGRIAIALATVTLVIVGIRLIISVRGVEALSQERHRQSVTDELTGLWNRRYAFRVLDAFFTEREETQTERSLAFLFVDLDHFKEINDSFGHPAGDELLRQLGARLQSSLRDKDLLVRLGGDEFAVVLIDGDADYAASVADRLTACLREPFTLDVVSATIGASIGIAVAPSDATDSARLVWCADVAMYRAKLSNAPFASFEVNIDEEHDQMRLMEELRLAIDEDELVLHYQPQLDLRTGEVLAVEALIRWNHPRLGLLPPDSFLPVAEEAGLMQAITRWVLKTAISQCASWRATGRALTVAVNVSPRNLLEPGFVDSIRSELDLRGVPAHMLVIEITENNVIEEFDTSRRIIEELQDLGIMVSIDDFGSGVTSLTYLSNLSVRELKLDRSFIVGIAGGDRERELELVRSTIELGHSMGLRIVAEGIEDTATLQLLTELGCDLAQGYCISRPQPASELAIRPGSVDDESARASGGK